MNDEPKQPKVEVLPPEAPTPTPELPAIQIPRAPVAVGMPSVDELLKETMRMLDISGELGFLESMDERIEYKIQLAGELARLRTALFTNLDQIRKVAETRDALERLAYESYIDKIK